MKPPPKTDSSWDSQRAALRAMEKGDEEGISDGLDGSSRLLRYCRAAKRFGFVGDHGVRIVRSKLALDPLPKEYTDAQIIKRIVDAKVEVGEALDDDWEPQKQSRNGDGKEQKTAKPSIIVPASETLRSAFLLRIGSRTPEVLFDCGSDLAGIEIGPGKVTVIGAPPGTGKTSLASQVVFSVLKAHDIRVVIANAEMSADTLMLRELARHARVSYQKVRFCKFDDAEEGRLLEAEQSIRPLVDRMDLMEPPYTSERLVGGLGDVPGLLVVDYLQKFRKGSEALEGIEVVMGHLRFIASFGWAVLALSSTARQQGKDGKHSAKGLDMGSFRGSGEIEFQSDAAYVLRDLSDGAIGDRSMQLDCVKNRHGPRESIDLTFIASEMRFEAEVQKHDFGMDT